MKWKWFHLIRVRCSLKFYAAHFVGFNGFLFKINLGLLQLQLNYKHYYYYYYYTEICIYEAQTL